MSPKFDDELSIKDERTQSEGHVKPGVAIGAFLALAKEHLEPCEPARGEEVFFPRALRGNTGLLTP